MQIDIPLGTENEVITEVTYDKTAAVYGSGLVEVFATPALVALMENTALQSVMAYLPEGYSTVGTAINISHSKATPIGQKVYCKSVLTYQDRRKLVFDVVAHDEKGEIGRGTHTRFIIDMKNFMEKLK